MKEQNNKDFLKPILWSSNCLGLIFIDKNSAPFWILNMGINLIVAYYSVVYIQMKIAANFDNCFKKNFCSDVVEAVNKIIQPTGTLLLALFHCRRLKKEIIVKTSSYLAQVTLPISWVHKYFVLVFISTYALITSFNLGVTSLVELLLHFVNASGFLVTDILILTLCLAIQKSYESVNDRLEAMVKLKYIDMDLMNKIIAQHWDLCKLINDVNTAFGVDLVIRMLYTVIRITMLLFTILEYHSADELGRYAMLVLAEETFEVLMFAFKIFYTCYRGSQLTSEGKRTLIIIREINLKLEDNISRNRAHIKQSLDIFTIRVNCQDIQVSASGFVTINLELIQSLVGLILTYWIVLVQFQGDQDTKKPTPNS